MKSTPRRKTSKKIILTLLCVALVIAGGFTAYAVTTSNTAKKSQEAPLSSETDKTPTVNTEVPTDDQVKAGNEAKDNTVKQNDSPSQNSNLSASITYTQVSDQAVRVGTLIESLTTDGTCLFTATKSGSSSVVQSTTIQTLNNSSTCKGFSVPLSEFTSKGQWNYSIKIDSAGQTITLNGTFTL